MHKVGGMAHAMLPADTTTNTNVIEAARGNVDTSTTFAKYVDRAIDALIVKMVQLGAKQERLRAKIVGGARMFRLLSGDQFGIGFKNAEIAKKHLSELGIFLEGEDVGGTVGRNATLQLDSGLVSVGTMM